MQFTLLAKMGLPFVDNSEDIDKGCCFSVFFSLHYFDTLRSNIRRVCYFRYRSAEIVIHVGLRPSVVSFQIQPLSALGIPILTKWK